MSNGHFQQHFPILCELLKGSRFDATIARAEALGNGRFQDACRAGQFSDQPLLLYCCGALVPEWMDPMAEGLERGLSRLCDTLGVAVVRGAYRNKLLTVREDTLIDACYEVTAASLTSTILDPGTLELEKLLPNGSNNSDIFGLFQGSPVRFEVTVLHETMQSVDLDLTEALEKAPIRGGFEIQMRRPLKDKAETDEMIDVLVALHRHHSATNGGDIRIHDLDFCWNAGRYRTHTGILESVSFYHEGDRYRGHIREIHHHIENRLITPAYARHHYPQPEGVTELADIEKLKLPLSKKVLESLERKASRQCEEGITNILVFGNPREADERDLLYALFGTRVPIISYTEDDMGRRELRSGRTERFPLAPFIAAENLPSPESISTFIDPYRPISAIWHLRLGQNPLAQLFENPNAHVTLPSELRDAFLVALRNIEGGRRAWGI